MKLFTDHQVGNGACTIQALPSGPVFLLYATKFCCYADARTISASLSHSCWRSVLHCSCEEARKGKPSLPTKLILPALNRQADHTAQMCMLTPDLRQLCEAASELACGKLAKLKALHADHGQRPCLCPGETMTKTACPMLQHIP